MIHVLDVDDHEVATIGNITGPKNDVSAVSAKPGRFHLDIVGDEWAVILETK